jgi:hypothetical protein
MNLTPRIHSRNGLTPMETNATQEARELLNADRASAERALHAAEDKPVLSGEQSCAVAQVHALLAIEQRLSQLAASIDAILIALAHPGNVGGEVVPTGAR